MNSYQTTRASLVALLVFAAVPGVGLAAQPVALTLSARVGWKINGGACVGAAQHPCGRGQSSDAPGGFKYPSGVAVDPANGDIYVADTANHRIQKLTATGAFIAMFGSRVNATKDRLAIGTNEKRDICTAISGDACTAGRNGTGAGELTSPTSIAVDPVTGAVYVLEVAAGDFKVVKYTSAGHFVWMIGRHVNRTNGADVCAKRDVDRGMRCGQGHESPVGTMAPYAFKFAQFEGNLLAAGGPEDLLYVGDEHRIQEFDASGRWRGQIVLASLSAGPRSVVASLALDKIGDLFAVYHGPIAKSDLGTEATDAVYRFDWHGNMNGKLLIRPQRANGVVTLDALAVDSSDRLAVIGGIDTHVGAIYDVNTGAHLSNFVAPSDNDGIAFSPGDYLYVADPDEQQIVAYAPGQPVQLFTSPAPCRLASTQDKDAAFNCVLGRPMA
jgi:hypothetical protein